jgi:prevent-host-death family protein
MTIHVNIAEAKARLSSLVKASLRGEEVVIDRDGKPQVRLTPVPEAQQIDHKLCRHETIRVRGMPFLGYLPELSPNLDEAHTTSGAASSRMVLVST